MRAFIALISALQPLLARAGSGGPPRRPHILFIVADDLGYNDVSFHGANGSAQVPTPHIDALAKQGVELRNYYVQPVCSPTRSSFMTGRHVIHTGVYNADCNVQTTLAVRREFTMLPRHLRNLGYETHAVGKWHLGTFSADLVPTARGFDTFYGYYNGAEDYYSHRSAQFRDFHDDVGATLVPQTADDGAYSTFLYAKRAVAIIESFALRQPPQNLAPAKPLFLYLAWQAIHAPDQVPQEYEQRFASITNPGRRTVAGMLAALDEGIGNVTAALRRTGLWDDTLIVFSTDNGGPAANVVDRNWASNWPLRGMKHTLWEGGIRGVGLIAGAGLRKTGYVSTELYHAVDLMPTLLSVALNGLDEDPASPTWQSWTSLLAPEEPPFQIGDGMDVWRSVATGSPSPRTEFIIEAHNTSGSGTEDGYGQAIRVGDYKLLLEKGPAWNWTTADGWFASGSQPRKYGHVVDCGGPRPSPSSDSYCHADRLPCLFNIREDPCEYRDLSKQMPEKVEELRRRLAVYQNTAVPVGFHHLGCSVPVERAVEVARQHNGTWMPWCPEALDAEKTVVVL